MYKISPINYTVWYGWGDVVWYMNKHCDKKINDFFFFFFILVGYYLYSTVPSTMYYHLVHTSLKKELLGTLELVQYLVQVRQYNVHYSGI